MCPRRSASPNAVRAGAVDLMSRGRSGAGGDHLRVKPLEMLRSDLVNPVLAEATEIFDPMGKDATLFHFASSEDEDAIDSRYIEQAQLWFDSVWDSIAREYDLS